MNLAPARARILAAVAAFAAAFALVIGRAVQLAAIEGASLRARAERQQFQRIAPQRARGKILDRNGEPLALSVPAGSIYLRPGQFAAPPEAVELLAAALRLDTGRLLALARRPAPFVWLKRRATLDERAAVERLGLPGVGIENGSRRFYPHGDLAAQLLGFTGVDGNGLEGVELQYDAALRGEEDGGVVVERDAHGRRMLTDGIRRPVRRQGGRVELTIDAALQHVAEIELERTVTEFAAAGGVAVAMDPTTGEILALAQVPRFDPNEPGAVEPSRRRNRAVTDSFEPGSTLKPFVAAAALEAGLAHPDERMFCERGRYAVGRTVVRDHESYGWLTLAEAVQFSSNICMAKVGERLGRERLGAGLLRFGFGLLTGIDLPGEAPGLFPPPARWGRIHVVTASFGQGISVTAIQLARAFAALANGGALVRPFAVRRVTSRNGTVIETHPEIVGRPISEATARTVTAMLERVVAAGTGKKAQIPGVRVAGKTGTAQKPDLHRRGYSPRDRVASFVGYAPAEAPRILVAVVIDRPRTATYGGTVAAPAFRRIAEYALEASGVPRDTPAPPLEVAPATSPPVPVALHPEMPLADRGVPSVLGLGMRDGVALLRDAGYVPQVEGWGVAREQDPAPGTEAEAGSRVRVRFGCDPS